MPAFAQDATLLEKYDYWAVYKSSGSPTACFIVGQPVSKAPSGVRRGPVYFYATRYPAEGIKNEISVKMGYPFGPGAKVTVDIDGKKFTFFTKNEGAFVDTRAGEDQVIAAMKAGTTMVIQGTSARGTLTTDRYSLNGVTAAVARLDKDCK
ncbi:invasion associated locus B family protein [Methyloligella sp. 2.7D]|uniref:invasion associated locus B family protein n=1 Tax=unclassified Methyloligella TaxID=2625955 RepID=UPI00157CA271|nr:invasion associated locus B family protein [Methyloligella sp. GL2]QKP76317.1 hypothetical protein HT051_01905 [Methyloligella sp. GL2]